jgi:hypothetical protein
MVLLSALLCVVIAMLLLSILSCRLWGGRFELTVKVTGDTGSLQSVRCETYGNQESAEKAVKNPSLQDWSAKEEPFIGQPLTIRVPMGGREYLLWESSWSQYRYLAIVGEMKDGKRISKVVEIPDGRISREITIAIP